MDAVKHFQTYGITHEEMQKQHTELNARVHAQHQAAQEKKKNKSQKPQKLQVQTSQKQAQLGPCL